LNIGTIVTKVTAISAYSEPSTSTKSPSSRDHY